LRTATKTSDALDGSSAPRCSEINLAAAVGKEKSATVTKITNEKVRAEIDPISSWESSLARTIIETRLIENCIAF